MGPLDVLKSGWTDKDAPQTTTLEWMLELRSRLDQMKDIAIQTQTEVQAETKARYDKHGGGSSSCTIKLTAQWTGPPYLVENKLSPVTYTARMPDKRKKTRTIHINMMKLWHPPAAAVFSTSQKPAGEDDLGLDKLSFTTLLEADTGLMLGPDLTTDPKQEVSDHIGQHPEVFTNIPDLTQAAQLHMVADASLPTRTNPRTVPKAWQGKVD